VTGLYDGWTPEQRVPLGLVQSAWGYQGEANSGDPYSYNCSFPAMIDDWRAQFHAANNETAPIFPFGE